MSRRLNDGAIALPIRIGVVGHRVLPDPDHVAGQVSLVIQDIQKRAIADVNEPRYTVVSSLAVGADRLVTRRLLERVDADLIVPLPFGLEEYVRSFNGDDEEFYDIVRSIDEEPSGAHRVTLLEPLQCEDSDSGYRNAGRRVVDNCDVLIAVWDGTYNHLTGGTSDVLSYAEGRDVPRYLINSKEALPYRVESEESLTRWQQEAKELEHFNRHKIRHGFGFESQRRRHQLVPTATWTLQDVPSGELIEWMLPPFTRADNLALRYQARAYISTVAVLALSVAAVGLASGLKIFGAGLASEFALLEIPLILGALGWHLMARYGEVARRWADYRFLAEQLRSALYLAVAGVEPRIVPDDSAAASALPGDWLRNSVGEVWKSQPSDLMVDESKADGIREFLLNAWLVPQRDYHSRSKRRNESGRRWTTRILLTLLVLTTMSVVLHSIDTPHVWLLPEVFLFLAIFLPAVGAATEAYRQHREFGRNAKRSERVVLRLRQLETDLVMSATVAEIRRVATSIADVLSGDSRDWYGVMASQEPPTPT